MEARTSVLGPLTVLAALACSRPTAPPPAAPMPPHLARVPDGHGVPYAGQPRLTVRERRLVLPDDRVCRPEEPACAAALADLQDGPLAIDLSKDLLMAELSEPLALLARALAPGETACLLVADSASMRCVPFRPFGSDDFAAWLDASKPLGKVRVILRGDGMEVVARRGKLPGPDRYGPSLPTVAGKPDFDGLERAAAKLAAHFSDEEEAALAPSGATRLEVAARALSSLSGPAGERFGTTYLVYP